MSVKSRIYGSSADTQPKDLTKLSNEKVSWRLRGRALFAMFG